MAAETSFVGVRVQGGLLPAELLSRLSSGRDIPGLSSADYGLAHGESVREGANRVWAYLTGVWSSYRAALEGLPEHGRATTLTRDRWLQIVLDQLGYGRVPTSPAGGITAGDKSFPISHLWQSVPVHLLGSRIELDRRTAGVAGAAGQAPQSMVQELLNRTDDHLWAVLSNGSTWRLLRDSTSLVGAAYIEFDLEAIFDGELFSDFLLFYTVCHSSRLEVRDAEVGPASCWLEQWRELAFESGSRALNQLREGVVEAIEILGAGFLGHPENADLRGRYESEELSKEDFNHALLRVVYRMLFSFVAEDRGALLSPEATPEARRRYAEYFSAARLRTTSRRRRGGRHGDRWRALQIVWAGLGSAEGRPELGIAGIGGLFDPGPLDVVTDAALSNEALLTAVRALSVVTEKGTGFKRVVNHRDLGAEELGSIYESLLEYVPTWDPTTREYKLAGAAGNTRKTTGSYYTPTSLIESLLDTSLDPLLNEAEKLATDGCDAERRLLEVTVCDPACGSGHFLVAAARRIAKRVASVRTGDPEPPPEQVRTALRDVVGRSIFGVDLNPLAAELAKVSLWLEAMEPGRPLAFLDAQIKVGNALVGSTPVLLDQGIPQEAFKPVEGDDKKAASALAKRNKEEAGGQTTLFGVHELKTSNADLVTKAVNLSGQGLSLADIHIQQQRLREYERSPEYKRQRHAADAWCAAFVWRKTNDATEAVTNAAFEQLRTQDDEPNMATAQNLEISRLAAEYRFFHWHLEFPHIFPTERPDTGGAINPDTGWYGGFSVVLGNPPFLNQLEQGTAMKRGAAAVTRLLSGGRIGAYTDVSAIFLQRAVDLVRQQGFVAMVQPQSLLAARDAMPIRQSLSEKAAMRAMWASDVPVFPGVAVLTCAPTLQRGAAQEAVTVLHGPRYSFVARKPVSPSQLRGEWSFLISEGLGIPDVVIAGDAGVLGSLGPCTADFRDQYYGLVPYVLEGDPTAQRPDQAPLITTGLIEPAECLWGATPTRFNKQKWEAPVVDLHQLSKDPKLADWGAKRLVPKLLVATQGSVIEAVADEDGTWLPSVPVVTMTPSPDLVWHALSVLLAPPVVAYAASTFAGTGLTMKAIKLSAKQLAALPLPSDQATWDEGARLAAMAQHAGSTHERNRLLAATAAVMCRAYGVDGGTVMSWWLDRAGIDEEVA